MKLVNLTPHSIHLLINEVWMFVQPSGLLARVNTRSLSVFPIVLDDGTEIPVMETKLDQVVGLPAPAEGVVYVVSRIVLDAVRRSRADVYAPFDFVRDDDGDLVGCRALGR